jgi:hypothetical protein
MYGIINRAIEELVIENFGNENWLAVKAYSGVDIDFFLSNEPYDDDITYKLASSVAAVMNIPLPTVMEVFGEWWVLRTSKEKYGGLMEAGGSGLKEFLHNLPAFHSRVMLIYPKLTPPEFRVSDETEHSIHVHYYSKRVGLQDFVRGLLTGLGKMFNTPAVVQLIQSRDDGSDHEIFKVIWE